MFQHILEGLNDFKSYNGLFLVPCKRLSKQGTHGHGNDGGGGQGGETIVEVEAMRGWKGERSTLGTPIVS